MFSHLTSFNNNTLNMYSGPAFVAWMGGNHTDSRFRRGMGGTLPPQYECQTSNIPFLAMITGKQHGGFEALGNEIKPLNAALAVAASSMWVLRRIKR
ncbi:MAG: putative membrane protein [Bacillariaceae sp.]